MRNRELSRGADSVIIQSPVVSSTTKPTSNYISLNDLSNPQVVNNELFPRLRCRQSIRPNNVNAPILRRHLEMPLPAEPPILTNEVDTQISTKHASLSIGIIFLSALIALYFVYTSFPALNEDEKPHMKIPMNLEEAKKLSIVLDKYKNNHYYEVLFGICVTYIFLQTFAIPGSLFLSILSGFLFSFPVALTLICSCSAIGASLCYLISQLLGRRIVLKYFPERAEKWRVMVKKHEDNIFNYILFLRITPFLPNWFINLTAPVIGVPLVPFATGTFFGVAPPSFVAIQAGRTIHSLSSTSDAFSWTSITILVLFAGISILPVLMKGRLRDKFE